MKKVLSNYSSKNNIDIRQIVAYKNNILEIEEYKEGTNIYCISSFLYIRSKM